MGNDAIIPYVRRIHNGNSIQPSARIHAMPEENDPINFIPDDLLVNEEPTKNAFLSTIFNWTIKSGRKILVITAAIVITIFFIRIKIDRDISKSLETIEEQEARILSMSQIEKEHTKLQKKIEIIKLANSQEINWFDRFNRFSDTVPEDIKIEEISYSKTNIRFSALAKTSQSFGIFLTTLISDTKISEILLTASKYNPEDKSYSFSLEIKLYE